jgi:hypothetical protein
VRTSIFLAALVLLFAVSSSTQEVEHAPTVAQCQADQALWISKLESETGVSTVKFRTLDAWQREMNDCKQVDETNSYKYFNVETEVEAEFSRREFDFIVRRGLLNQFMNEDAAGKR